MVPEEDQIGEEGNSEAPRDEIQTRCPLPEGPVDFLKALLSCPMDHLLAGADKLSLEPVIRFDNGLCLSQGRITHTSVPNQVWIALLNWWPPLARVTSKSNGCFSWLVQLFKTSLPSSFERRTA